jgi:cystathionine gamma-lyase/cystathionine beta-lyase/cystathionine gamma-lyase/homocysteine desulfhydrase
MNEGFSTLAVHAGQQPDPSTGAVMPPIFLTSTYAQESPGVHKGFDYSRTANPTRLACEMNLAALEGGRFGYAFASGMAAIDCTFRLCKSGDHIIVSANTYGGTFRLADKVLKDTGLDFSFVNTSDLDEVRRTIKPNTRMIFVETPTNPMMTVSDLQALAEIADEIDAISVCENTFMSPYLQRPFEFGMDIVVHSTTKYINGHSDGLGGVIILNDEKMAEQVAFLQNSIGAILSPFEAWLILRGTKTLPLRMQQHDRAGREVARFLDEHPRVLQVNYPGLPSHPQHELAKRQQKGFGGIISFDVGTLDNARALLENVRLCTLAESLGGVETLISHPLIMTHASVPAELRQRLGITDGLIRLSVGVEDISDIIDDLDRALGHIK